MSISKTGSNTVGILPPRYHLSYCSSNSYVSIDRSFAMLRMTERRSR